MIVLFSSVFLYAEDYTLDKCIKIAYENNLDLKQKEIDLETFEKKVSQAYSSLFPSVTFTSGIARVLEPDYTTISLPDTDRETTNGMIPMQGWSIEYPKYGFQHAISVQQIIFSAQAFMGVKIARDQKDVEQLNYDLLKKTIKSTIEKAFYNVLITDKVIDITKQSYEQDLSHNDITHKKFEEGLVSEFDVIRSDVKLKSSLSDLENARLNHRMARAYMFLLLDIEYDQDAEFVGEFSKPTEIPDLEQSIEKALENRLEISILDNSLKVLNSVIGLYRANYIPNLVFQGSFEHMYASDELGDYAAVDDFSKDYTIALGLQWTLFDGFKRESMIAESKANYKKLTFAKEQAIAGIKTEIRNTCWRLEQSKNDFESALSSLDEAQKLIDIANVQHEEGMITFVELNDAQLAYDATLLKYHTSLYNFNSDLSDFNLSIGK